jgi:hypothetical protein
MSTNKGKPNSSGTPLKRQRDSLGNTTGDPKRTRTDTENNDQATNRTLAGLKPRTRTRTDSGVAATPATGNFEQSIDMNPDPAMRTATDARAVLEAALYLPTNAGELTTSQLANAILIFIATVSPEKMGVTNAQHLRAIAILLHHEDTSSTAQLIASKVADIQEKNSQQIEIAAHKLGLATMAVESAAASLEERSNTFARQGDVTEVTTGNLRKVAEDVKNVTEEMKKNTVTAARQCEIMQETTQEMAAAAVILNEAAEGCAPRVFPRADRAEQTDELAEAMAGIAEACDADRARSGMPPINRKQGTQGAHAAPSSLPQAAARAKALADERNIILDIDGDQTEAVAKLSEQELVDRATSAIERMGTQAGDRPETFAFVAASKLAHGGIRYRMADRASTEWIKKPDVRVAFAAAFGGGGGLKDKTYTVITEYASTQFDPSNVSGLDAVARLNGIPGNIASARWLKRVEKRRPGQRAAFLEVSLRTPAAANALIKAGCVIHGRTLRTRKKLVEPRRCMKCNKFTSKHTAATCRAEHDTCTNCSGDHRESACTEQTPKCANCQGEHAASDRSCPRYLEEVKRIRERIPDNRFPLFPEAGDPLTWIPDDEDAQNEQEQNKTGDGGGWRTVGPRRGRQPGYKTKAADKAQGGKRDARPSSLSWEGRSRSRSRQGTEGRTSRTASRTASPLRQQTLHEVSPRGILRTPARQRADANPDPANNEMSMDE